MMREFIPRSYTLLLFVLLFLWSCRKEDPALPPTASASFALVDSLKVDASFSTGAFSDIYNKYNGLTYTVNSNARVTVTVRQTGTALEIYFTDSSVQKLYPAFLVAINGGNVNSLAGSYDLSVKGITVNHSQQFMDGSFALGPNAQALAGSMTLAHDKRFDLLSGKIQGLRVPLEYYVPEDLSLITRSSNGGILRLRSVRRVDLEFRNVKVSRN